MKSPSDLSRVKLSFTKSMVLISSNTSYTARMKKREIFPNRKRTFSRYESEKRGIHKNPNHRHHVKLSSEYPNLQNNPIIPAVTPLYSLQGKSHYLCNQGQGRVYRSTSIFFDCYIFWKGKKMVTCPCPTPFLLRDPPAKCNHPRSSQRMEKDCFHRQILVLQRVMSFPPPYERRGRMLGCAEKMYRHCSKDGKCIKSPHEVVQ
ncbi:hypothetical protein CDAR_120461 [Caerostris darwini]|uniref:Uncharacterized protein n=1 Tax=Caerostris darwini TaxID=1538125 RepID=A0AAV4W8C9_9ARAC|nr:hypothetical protein CDAR_120461 [Caerostris darwini]